MAKPDVGEWVRLVLLPPWVSELPPESQAVFRLCLGNVFQVVEVDEHGHLVLDVSDEADATTDGTFNDIRVEPGFVEAAPVDRRSRATPREQP